MKGILVYAIYTFWGDTQHRAGGAGDHELVYTAEYLHHTGQDLYGVDPLHRTDRRAMPKFYEQI